MNHFKKSQKTEKEVKAYLDPMTNEAKFCFYERVDSTNQIAKEWALSGAPGASFVIADEQTGGRGRGKNRFFSPAGGIYLSVIYRGSDNEKLADYLTVAGAAVTAEAISTVTGVDCGIKWVNDLFVRGKKVCGLLAESVFRGDERLMVLGIGINLFMPQGGFPEDLPGAGAVLETPPDAELRVKLIAAMADGLTRLKEVRDYSKYISIYRKRFVIVGKTVMVTDGDARLCGVVRGFDDLGHLVLDQDGQSRIVRAGTLRLARETK